MIVTSITAAALCLCYMKDTFVDTKSRCKLSSPEMRECLKVLLDIAYLVLQKEPARYSIDHDKLKSEDHVYQLHDQLPTLYIMEEGPNMIDLVYRPHPQGLGTLECFLLVHHHALLCSFTPSSFSEKALSIKCTSNKNKQPCCF